MIDFNQLQLIPQDYGYETCNILQLQFEFRQLQQL